MSLNYTCIQALAIMDQTEVYCAQLEKLSLALHQKRPGLVNRNGVVLHHDNARPHTALVTPGKVAAAWVGDFASPSIFPRLGTNRFPFVSFTAEFIKWEAV